MQKPILWLGISGALIAIVLIVVACIWMSQPDDNVRQPNERKQIKIKEAAVTFYEACSKNNWNEVQKFWGPVSQYVKEYLGGLQIISLGEPFKSKDYGGYYVPYEIKLKSGYIKKYNLAIRYNTSTKRYEFDGGM